MRFDGKFSHDASSEITRKLLARADRPSAIFCANDFMAFGAQDALRELGVPARDCWVVGYDDVEMASWASFSLTTVRQPTREMVGAGVAMLLERIEQPDLPPRRVCYPSALLIRGSTPLSMY